MGYTSDTAYKICFSSIEKRDEAVALLRVNGGTMWEALCECDVPDDEPEIRFSVQTVKWYDTFPIVQGHHDLLHFIEDNFEDDAGYRFLRVGEDTGDNDDRSGGNMDLICWDISICRYIDLDFDGENYTTYKDKLKEEEHGKEAA